MELEFYLNIKKILIIKKIRFYKYINLEQGLKLSLSPDIRL